MTDVYIVSAVRTPIGKFGGMLAEFTQPDLGTIAVRAALGASQSRLIRQLLTESVLLAVTGGAIGLLWAQWGTTAALRILPSQLPRAAEIRVDSHVLLFTMSLSLLAGILFGLAPAL